LPRMFPPIMKCVARDEILLLCRNELRLGLAALGPSSKDS